MCHLGPSLCEIVGITIIDWHEKSASYQRRNIESIVHTLIHTIYIYHIDTDPVFSPLLPTDFQNKTYSS